MFITQIFVQQFNEVAIPLIKQKVEIWQENRKLRKESKDIAELTQAEAESKLDAYDR